MLTWRPARPAAYIRARLAPQAAAEHAAAALEAAESWNASAAFGAFTAPRAELLLDLLQGVAAGMAAYSAMQAARGLDDLTDFDAAADVAAFCAAGIPA